jgi:hypothetical protein
VTLWQLIKESIMGHRQVSHYSDATNRLLDKLSLAIDKKTLTRKIVNTYAQVRKIESIAGPSKESQKLRQKITSLQNQLAYTRSLATKDS